MLNALKQPGVRWILGLHGADLVLEYASSIALMVLVYDATNAPIAAAAMLVAKQVVPGALLAWLGRLLDTVEPRRGLAIAYGLRAIALAALASAGATPALYGLAFVAGLAGTASRVLIRAMAVRSTTREAFRALTALQNIVFAVIALVGPALGAAGASWAGADASMLIWVVLSVALTGASLAMPAMLGAGGQGVEPDEQLASSEPGGHGRGSVGGLLALGAVLAVIFSMDEPALLAYVRHDLAGDVGLYGLILVTWGAGMVIGGLLYSRFGLGRPHGSIVVGVLAAALGYIGLGVAPSIGVACAAAVIGGAGNGSYWVALVTAVLEHAPPGAEAKASGRLEGLATAMPALGIALGGALAQFVEPRVTLWLPGMIAVLALITWMVAVRGSRAPLPAGASAATRALRDAPAEASRAAAAQPHAQAEVLA
jgi:hypothetical protein